MVTVLVVTYGDRWQLLKQVLARVATLAQVSEIILVDNGSQHVNQATSYLNALPIKSQHIVCDSNLGSAGAYKKGLQYFATRSVNRFVWLLDDDNLPEPDALTVLLKAADAKSTSLAAFLSLRPDRPYLVKAANQQPLQILFPTANSYLGFNLFKRSTNPFGLAVTPDCSNCTGVPMAPYGGVLLTKEVIASIGFPLEDFYLYGDDFEYTYRITARGGCICLVANSIVRDIDASWVSTGKQFLKPRMLFQNDFRSRYAIRNAVYFSNAKLKRSNLLFFLNELSVNVYYLAAAFIHLKPFLFFNYLKLAREGKRFTPRQ